MLQLIGAIILAGAAVIVSFFVPKDYRIWGRVAQAGLGALALFLFMLTSLTIIGPSQVGHLKRTVGGSQMPPGQIVAMRGQNGPQAQTLSPGLQFRFLLHVMYKVEKLDTVTITPGHYGFITALDGTPLDPGQILADEWPEQDYQKMLDAEYFLRHGGRKGPQLTVLTPGTYRFNRYLYSVEEKSATTVEKGEAGVVKSTVQTIKECNPLAHGDHGELRAIRVPKGCVGMWEEPLQPATYYLNEMAYTITKISTRGQAWEYKGGFVRRYIDLHVDQEGKITQTERSETVPVPADAADPAIFTRVEGWIVPLELRAIVQVAPEDAPFVIAAVGGLQQVEDSILTPTIRSVVRNVVGAEK